MNNDNFNGMNDGGLSAELEARVVAWVLGEASAFEAAELERLCAERPELAVFKRRLQAVHGLVGEAAKPLPEPLRLSPERRAKVLAVIGGGASSVEAGATTPVKARKQARSWREWALPMAACFTMMTLLAAVIIPTVGRVQQRARRVSEIAEFRSQEQLNEMTSDLQAVRVGGGTAQPVENGLGLSASLPEGYFRPVPGVVYPKSYGGVQSTVGEKVDAHRLESFTVSGSSDQLKQLFDSDQVNGAAVRDGYSAGLGNGARLQGTVTESSAFMLGVDSRTAGTAGGAQWGNASNELLHDQSTVQAAAEQSKVAEQPTPYVVYGGQSGHTDKFKRGAAEREVDSTITITAGTPQVFEMREVTAAEKQLMDRDEKLARAFRADQAQLAYGDVYKDLDSRRAAFADAEMRRRRDMPVQADPFATPAPTSAPVATESVETAAFPVSRAVVKKMLGGEDAPAEEATEGLREFFEQAGVRSGKNPDVQLAYDGEVLIVTQSARNVERIRNILNRYDEVVLEESEREEVSSAEEAISTFSLHVSDAGFRLARAALERGELPDAATVRPEEFYNAFDYGGPAPVAGEAVACRVEQAGHPFLQQRNLVRIAMRVPATGRGAGTALRLTVLLDTSGSMEREDRAATVRAALAGLSSLLGPEDRVTLVGFARTPRLLAENVTGDQVAKLVGIAARTPAEGGTNLEEALALAGELARRHKVAGAQNRIVLLTDGAANLGDANPEALAKRVEALRQNGIAFDACGVAADGLEDSVLEALTRKGDGRYVVIGSPEEADAGFARQLAGAFRPAAKDVKVQVRFNPARVGKYRLIGFEKHRLKTEDFSDDTVDAAELVAEEAAVALYQVEVLPDGEGELGEVSVRFLDTRSNERVERSWVLGYTAQPAAFKRATASMQLAGSAGFLAEKLRGGALAGQVRLEEFAPVVEGLAGAYPESERVREFVTMFRQARRITGE